MDTELKEKLDTLETNSNSIKKLLLGNGKMGIAEMARRAFEYMLLCKQTNNGLLDWAFRGFITILMTYIAIKIGLGQG